MKIAPTLLLLAAAVLGWIAWSAPGQDFDVPRPDEYVPDPAVPSTVSADIPEDYAVRTFRVEGMCCSGCTRKLYDALTDIEAVHAAAVDFEASLAKAVVPADFDIAVLATALELDKYTVKPLSN